MSAEAGGAWSVERIVGGAGALHGRDVGEHPTRTVWAFTVDTPALVLGSTQAADDVDAEVAASLGVDVVRRRSGGGGVLLDPGQALWVDVVIGRDDPLWRDDVSLAAEWMGEAWVGALASVGRDDAVVHRRAMVRTPMSPVVCFGGLGPGEVVAGAGKVVGISQRRTRGSARFQCAVPLDWDPDRHALLLAPGLRRVGPDLDPSAAVRSLAVQPLHDVAPDVLVEALVEQLP